jgi:hypothetical protein
MAQSHHIYFEKKKCLKSDKFKAQLLRCDHSFGFFKKKTFLHGYIKMYPNLAKQVFFLLNNCQSTYYHLTNLEKKEKKTATSSCDYFLPK